VSTNQLVPAVGKESNKDLIFPHKRHSESSACQESFADSRRSAKWPLETGRACDGEFESKPIRPPPVGPTQPFLIAFVLGLRKASMSHPLAGRRAKTFKVCDVCQIAAIQQAQMAWEKEPQHFLHSTLTQSS
jgi:hypothetical protein